jgi:hypothetical protein
MRQVRIVRIQPMDLFRTCKNSAKENWMKSGVIDRLAITDDPLVWIEAYARCELSLEELREKVRDAVGERFIHNPHFRVVNLNQICPTKAVRITPQHIEILLAKRRRGNITEEQMRDWAHMVTISDAYYWEPEDDNVVGEWVNFLFFDFRPKD